MDFSPEKKKLQKAINFMNLLLDAPLNKLTPEEVEKLSDTLSAYVKEIGYIDELYPLAEFAEKFERRSDREAFLEVLDLLEEADALLSQIARVDNDDDMLSDDYDDEDDPEAGKDPEALFAELIKNMKPGRHAS